MLELMARLRDIVLAIALAWLGVSVQTSPDKHAHVSKDRVTTAELQDSVDGGDSRSDACPQGMGSSTVKAPLRCLDQAGCPPAP